MNGACSGKNFFGPAPWAQGRGQKVKYHLISITKSIQRFLYQTLCVFAQTKETKHIRQDFYSVTWVMPKGSDLGVLRGQNQIPSCCLPVMLSPPKPLDEIQPNLVCFTPMQHHFFFGPPPWALGRGQKDKYHLISITKSILKIFIPNFVCVLTNETEGIFILSPGSCPRGRGCLGTKIKFRPAVCPLCYLLLNLWTKFNQICCVNYSREWGLQQNISFWLRSLGPWGGVKRLNII